MRTLLIESSPGAGVVAEGALTRAGAEVLRCHDRSGPAFPCREVAQRGTCPLGGSGRPDVAFVARSTVDREFTASEVGVACAIRHGVPVVVDLGPDPEAANPFGDLVAIAGAEGPVASCEAAISAAHGRVTEPLAAEVIRLLEDAGATDLAVGIEVVREGGECQIVVTVPTDAPVADEAVAVRVLGRYRAIEGDGPAMLVRVGTRRGIADERPEG